MLTLSSRTGWNGSWKSWTNYSRRFCWSSKKPRRTWLEIKRTNWWAHFHRHRILIWQKLPKRHLCTHFLTQLKILHSLMSSSAIFSIRRTWILRGTRDLSLCHRIREQLSTHRLSIVNKRSVCFSIQHWQKKLIDKF